MHKIVKNIPLRDFSNYKIGGLAKYFAEVGSVEDLKDVLRLSFDKLRIAQAIGSEAQARRDKIAILGGGTNILFSDQGFGGLVIYNKIKGIKLYGDTLKVGSGVAIEEILNFCIANGLSGLEWAGGLPGTIGGAVRGNAGAFGGEIKDSVSAVESVDLKSGKIKNRSSKGCNFSYRSSVFKNGIGLGEFITFVILHLISGNKQEIATKINEKIEYRNRKHPLNFPNIGSIFKNIPFESLPLKLKEEFRPYVKNDPFPVVPTAKIIALSGIKGKRIGGAMISDKHTNFIVNIDNATSNDVRQLISFAKQTIRDKYGIELEEEIIYLPA
ncbi:UDP-N-acetylmuramate dehydrogenase [Candidatus Roizmanbacteria bacterium]|nr:UDP-N-acetylmuramate dehydrogenase [Candidatus Roizmanbacteria bacterium]